MFTQPIILASTSPYRHMLLSRLGLSFAVCAPSCDETAIKDEPPQRLATRLAHTKAASVAKQHPDALIIGSDQVAWHHQQLIGKPESYERAVTMLRQLSGQTVSFYTALTLYNSAKQTWQEAMDITHVTLRELNETQIHHYLQREPEALFCAGAAKSEGLGSVLIQRIDTQDPNALIGLPLFSLVTMLSHENIHILA